MSRLKECPDAGLDTEQLLLLESQIAARARSFGVEFKRSGPATARHLLTLPAKHRADLKTSLEKLNTDFVLCAQEDVDPWDDKKFWQLSMRNLGVSYPGDLIDRMGPDDVVEAYDLDRRQIFRNMRFMEATSYSLLEVLSYEWPVLFERSRAITEQIMRIGEHIVWSENRIVEVAHIPEHYIREIRSSQPQVCRVQHKYIAPLFCGPDQPFGAMSICRGEVIIPSLDTKADNVAFI